MTRRIAAALCAVALSGAACVLPGMSSPPTAAQELKARMHAFVAARSVTMVGHVAVDGTTYQVHLDLDDRGEAGGVVEIGLLTVSVTLSSGQVYVQSTGYYAAQGLAPGNQWVLEKSGPLVDLLTRLANRAELAAALLAVAGSDVQRLKTTDSTGAAAIKLTAREFSARVPTRADAPPVRVVAGIDAKLRDGLADVRLALSDYGRPASITVPTTYLDRAQPDTWPARFAELPGPDTPFSYDSCDGLGCSLSAAFKNTGGRVGAATATFSIFLKGGALQGTCAAPIPATSNQGVVRAGCRIGFAHSADSQFTANVRVTNP